MQKLSAVIADDEVHLATHLQAMLAKLWPALEITGVARNGAEAVSLIRQEEPDIAFLDIKMPVINGLSVAMQCEGLCHVVFVTAYNEFAIEAFEHNAMDYLVKPVTQERLGKTIQRLQKDLASKDFAHADLRQMLQKLATELHLPHRGAGLQWIRAGKADTTSLIPVDDVLYFKAGDKYTSVATRDGEFVIRKPIRELANELDASQFWQINRGIIVNVHAIKSSQRELSGRCRIHLKHSDEVLIASRKYAHLFKQM